MSFAGKKANLQGIFETISKEKKSCALKQIWNSN